MIDHTGLGVTDYSRSREFYRQALASPGYRILAEFGDDAAGYGAEGYFAAFALDPDGHNVEVFYHEDRSKRRSRGEP